MEKAALRRENFKRLRALTSEAKSEQSAAIVKQLLNEPSFQSARTVFAYAAMTSEPDLDSLRLLSPDKRWGLSRVGQDGESLRFHEVSPGQKLVRSKFGFLEPDPESSPIISKPDLILVPGVGFDPKTMARLGRGKGHYDRYLAPLMENEPIPTVIGVCFSVQLISLIPERHDVPMTHLVCENGRH